ncbi:MAG TPA: M67 family metallopeptidase [Pyrinomonadaceae bacterium]|nr:M67 family metallopeptidase [Pyrinomonadaceae bacterium]
MFEIRRGLWEEMSAHARRVAPEECCGLLGGRGRVAASVYPLRNVAGDPAAAYEAAPEELFAAQRRMRAAGEELVGIYHSHPRSRDPVPSQADVRLAFYPSAVYFIIGLDEGGRGVPRAFRIFEKEGRWERAEFRITEQ